MESYLIWAIVRWIIEFCGGIVLHGNRWKNISSNFTIGIKSVKQDKVLEVVWYDRAIPWTY